MREKIENTLKAILKHVGQCGSCYGTEIGSRDEMRWLVEQAAREGRPGQAPHCTVPFPEGGGGGA